jgi:hypothetical protein
MFEKYIVPAIGVGAFIIGGLIAREKATEIVGVVQKAFSSDTPTLSS